MFYWAAYRQSVLVTAAVWAPVQSGTVRKPAPSQRKRLFTSSEMKGDTQYAPVRLHSGNPVEYVNWVLIERTRLSGLLSADRMFLGAYVVKLFRVTNQQMLKSSLFTQSLHILTEKEKSHWRNIYISCMSTELYLIPHQNNTWSLKM